MECSKCKFENAEGAKFCNECGGKLELACQGCGKANPHGSKFCNECGQSLAQATAHPPKDLSFDEKIAKIQRYLPEGLTQKILSQRDRIEGEKKQVTVMFCDMEGFTPLAERLGPEGIYSLMDQVYEILIHKVNDFGGTVNELTGDGIMAIFGAPIALEDAPQRAIRSGLAIHNEITRFSERMAREKGITPLRMRVGIHSGPVVVGTVGNDLRVEFKALGDTVNLASRMESLAEPGTIWVTEDTFKLTEGLYFAQLNHPVEAMEAVEPVAQLAREKGYRKRLGQIETIRGAYYHLVDEDFQKAITTYEEALHIAEIENDFISPRAILKMLRDICWREETSANG